MSDHAVSVSSGLRTPQKARFCTDSWWKYCAETRASEEPNGVGQQFRISYDLIARGSHEWGASTVSYLIWLVQSKNYCSQLRDEEKGSLIWPRSKSLKRRVEGSRELSLSALSSVFFPQTEGAGREGEGRRGERRREDRPNLRSGFNTMM